MILFFVNVNPVKGNQISVIGAATTDTTTEQTVEIPAGDYHVYIETDGFLSVYAVAICTAFNATVTLFSWSTDDDQDTWTGQVTFSSSTTVTFKFEIQTSATTVDYNMNFQIIFTDIDVSTITKSSIISEAPYAVEVILLGLSVIALMYVQKRRK